MEEVVGVALLPELFFKKEFAGLLKDGVLFFGDLGAFLGDPLSPLLLDLFAVLLGTGGAPLG